jgi:tetratricopeptide (TPR) repeat protein
MDEVIKREEASIIARELKDCQRHLKKGNIFSCLVCFEGVLKKMLSTKMLPGDSKQLNKDINSFQHDLAASKTFRDVYGPVTFRDDDIATALDFMKQLIEIKDEETRALLSDEPKAETTGEEGGLSKIQQIKVLIEKGDHAAAQELFAGNEDIISLLVDEYNAAGIEHRRAGRHEEAIKEFRKALVVLPLDEGLYYNLARIFIDKGAWTEAAETIGAGLKVNHDFTEGIKLLKYIRENGGIDD